MISGKKILVTGGLGFIGFNAVRHFAKHNHVYVVDDSTRVGVENNIRKIEEHGAEFSHVDISHFQDLKCFFYKYQPDIVIHLAAQVAVTLSVKNPLRDFQSNIVGSFNILELARNSHKKPTLLYASTNKVYGGNQDNIRLTNDRYEFIDGQACSEQTQLSFETPYGCSKGSADQYFLDYTRTYDVPCVVFRQSCIYGPFQYGAEDQGWLAWFAICSILNLPISIYGDGKQVRDVLYIDDLLDLYERALVNIDSVKGQVFNVGGGPANTLTLNELVGMLERHRQKSLNVSYTDWRLGDQKVYISDIRKAEKFLGWKPHVQPSEGVQQLLEWIKAERSSIEYVISKQHKKKNQYDVSIVIPAKNEEASLPSVLDEINLATQQSSYTYEVIVVNDRSTDKTVEVAQKYPFVTVIDSVNPPGKGGALRSGFDVAKGTYLAMMDADFSHDAFDLATMVDEVRKHEGLVVASRITGGSDEYTRIRAFGNIFLTWLFGLFHGRYLSDALNGFKVFHRHIYFQYEYNACGYEIEIELLVNTLRLKRSITEVPSQERSRLGGRLKSSVVRDGTKFMLKTITEHFRTPRLRKG